MNILFRNFLRLLSAGTFGTDEAIEPMSGYKWNKLILMAKGHGIQDFVYAGITKAATANGRMIPQATYALAQSCQAGIKTATEDGDGRQTFQAARREKKFSNIILNNKYGKIVFNEVHSIDTSIETLVFLDKMISNVNNLLNSGVILKDIADIGFYLRSHGDKIDFVKAEDWFKQLKLRMMADIIGCHLILLFHFDKEELQYTKSISDKLLANVAADLEKAFAKVPEAAYDDAADNTNAIYPVNKPSAQPLKYFRSFPVETSSRFVMNIIKSLSNIDE